MEEKVDFYIFTHASSVEAAVKTLEEHSLGLEKLLTDMLKGVLIVYVAPADAWSRMIRFVSTSHSGYFGHNFQEKMEQRTEFLKSEIQFLTSLDKSCQRAIEIFEKRNPHFLNFSSINGRDVFLHRVRFVSPLAFVPIFDRIKSRQRDSFVYWFEQSTYDVPKLADAMIRIRNFGSQIPVLRFDFDVLFSEYALGDEMLKIRHSVIASMKQYKLRMKDPLSQSWYFSGQYFYEPLFSNDKRKEFIYWSQAFSTRATPALILTKELCNREQFTEQKGWKPTEETLNQALHEKLFCNFFGVSFNEETKQIANQRVLRSYSEDMISLGNGFIGANPVTACVSGSAFCVSSGITLDLPPFSNFRSNVLWIDDDLLVRLAQRVKRTSTQERQYGDITKHYSAGNPIKERVLPDNVVYYTFEIYLPTFVYGCIVDAWLTSGKFHYLEKFTPSTISNLSIEELHDGPLTRAAREVLNRGRNLEKDVLIKYRTKLRQHALERVKEIYFQWRSLKNGAGETLASVWATGTVSTKPELSEFCSDLYSEKELSSRCKRFLQKGCGLVRREWHEKAQSCEKYEDLPELLGGDLNPHFEKAGLYELIDDAMNYLEWILVWPSVVQAVRADYDGESVLDPVVWERVIE